MKVLASFDVRSRAKARFTTLAPRSARGFAIATHTRPLQNLAPRRHVVVAASAATKFGHVHYPAPSAGLSLFRTPLRATVARPALRSTELLACSQLQVAQTLLSVRSGAAARISES